jgi:hypothetical protein
MLATSRSDEGHRGIGSSFWTFRSLAGLLLNTADPNGPARSGSQSSRCTVHGIDLAYWEVGYPP